MAVAFESISNDAYGSKSTTTVAAPTGIANGDLLLAFMFVFLGTDPEAPTPPAGWSLAPGTWPIALTPPGEFADCYVYSKVAASESGSYSWTHAAARSTQGVVARFSGVDTTTPFDVTPSQNTGTGPTLTWNSITTVTDGSMIVAAEWDFADNTTDTIAPTGTTPTFTERLDVTLTYVASGVLATAGATGSKTHTCNNTTGSVWASTMLALRPTAATSIVSPVQSFGPSYAAHRAASI